MSKCVLVTRPLADLTPLAQKLTDMGAHYMVCPMLTIRIRYSEAAAVAISLEKERIQAVLFTSRNAVRAFSSLNSTRDIRVLCVGENTAAFAREQGFVNVDVTGATSVDMLEWIKTHISVERGGLYYPSAAIVATDVYSALLEQGFDVGRHVLYDAFPTKSLPDGIYHAFFSHAIDIVLSYSARTSQALVDCIVEAELVEYCQYCDVVAISQQAAQPLRSLTWRNIYTPVAPTQESMLALLKKTL